MLTKETAHYLFYYNENTKAGRDICEIAAYQEACFKHICDVLKVTPQFKLEYYLCNSPEEVGNFCGELCGDYEPCNGFADTPNKIYAVYNDEIQCTGFHEDAHLISYIINRPECVAIRERLTIRHIVEDDWQSIKVIRDDFALSSYSQYDIPISTEEDDMRARIAKWVNANKGTEHMFFCNMP